MSNSQLYTVKMTMYAIAQVKNIISYISHELASPALALAWSNYLEQQMENLNFFPTRFSLIEIEPWKTLGIRKMLVKNFITYYWIDEGNSTVWITAVIYEKRNQINVLKEMPLID